MSDNSIEKEVAKVRRIFISYSWTSPDYVDRVRELAEELAGFGLDVELDQWSLKEGDDKFHYMESMVNDPAIEKVLILLDKKYKEKADGREGGVGTEATIMTPTVYVDVVEKRGKQKFLPVIMERDPETGKEFVPTFLEGRKYTDLSNGENYAENLEELVRAIHNRPLHRKPVPGKIPNFILAEETSTTGTAGRNRRAIEFLRNSNSQAFNAVKEYFGLVIENLGGFDFPSEANSISYDDVLNKIQEITPLRDELVDCIFAIAKYTEDTGFYEELRNFFEKFLKYFECRNEGDANNEWAADHYKFLGYEVFLYTIAALLKFNRFSQLNELTEQGYFSTPSRYNPSGNQLQPFLTFCTTSRALDAFNRSQPTKYLSYDSYLIQQRALRSDIKLEDIMQADLFLYILYETDKFRETIPKIFFLEWYPATLIYAQHKYTPFEIFSRSQSLRFFERLRVALRNHTKDSLIDLFSPIAASNEHSYHSFRRRLPQLMGLELIASRP